MKRDLTPTDDHFPYSKRAMAKELVDVMAKLGLPTFTLIGHDRGGSVSYRMALDHPMNVERLAAFDVIPILGARESMVCLGGFQL